MRLFAAGPRCDSSVMGVRGVGSGFTSTTWAPWARASPGSEAAGCTMPDVPTTRKSSACCAAFRACSMSAAGSASPNHTTCGRSSAPHGQRGGISGNFGRRSSFTVPSRVHRVFQRLPCNSTTWSFPAAVCSPSTFCVTKRNQGSDASRRFLQKIT